MIVQCGVHFTFLGAGRFRALGFFFVGADCSPPHFTGVLVKGELR